MGRPSKELYSICGLLLMMEYFGWTREQTAMFYMIDNGVQYALNVEADGVELSERTSQRYLKYLRESDMESLPEVETKLQNEGHLPEKMYIDAGYSSAANEQISEAHVVELIAPAPHQPAGKVGLDECKFDENNKIAECPAGMKPILASFKNGKGRAVFFKSVYDQCPFKDKCRSQKSGKQNRQFIYGMPELRAVSHRKREATEEFKQNYGSKRCPIEGLNGRLKQFTPLRRLRVRGRKTVYHSIYAILLMHNIMQVVLHAKIQAKKAYRVVYSLLILCQKAFFPVKRLFPWSANGKRWFLSQVFRCYDLPLLITE